MCPKFYDLVKFLAYSGFLDYISRSWHFYCRLDGRGRKECGGLRFCFLLSFSWLMNTGTLRSCLPYLFLRGEKVVISNLSGEALTLLLFVLKFWNYLLILMKRNNYISKDNLKIIIATMSVIVFKSIQTLPARLSPC